MSKKSYLLCLPRLPLRNCKSTGFVAQRFFDDKENESFAFTTND
jgi:hypothetical protein